jgi:L-lactate dehydrogenase complex protein LldG
MTTLYEQFETRARAVSAEVLRAASKTEALSLLKDLLRAEDKAVWSNASFLTGEEELQLTRDLPAVSFHFTQRDAAAAAIGITEIESAIAATGTLVTDAADVQRRLASTLPPTHVAILPTAAIQPDMAAAFTRIHPARSGYISLITGPSRTADIERVLTIGVHGPSRLVILCIDDMEQTQ